MSKKFSLEGIEVSSFVTRVKPGRIMGGDENTADTSCYIPSVFHYCHTDESCTVDTNTDPIAY